MSRRERRAALMTHRAAVAFQARMKVKRERRLSIMLGESYRMLLRELSMAAARSLPPSRVVK